MREASHENGLDRVVAGPRFLAPGSWILFYLIDLIDKRRNPIFLFNSNSFLVLLLSIFPYKNGKEDTFHKPYASVHGGLTGPFGIQLWF